MSSRPVDKREKRLKDLANVLCKYNRSDLTLTMGHLSLEFYRQAALAEGYVHGDDLECRRPQADSRSDKRYLNYLRGKKT
jgi:hypothetical protein